MSWLAIVIDKLNPRLFNSVSRNWKSIGSHNKAYCILKGIIFTPIYPKNKEVPHISMLYLFNYRSLYEYENEEEEVCGPIGKRLQEMEPCSFEDDERGL